MNKTVLITGHTHGIGKALYALLFAKGYSVVGWSRETGQDISKKEIRQALINVIENVNISLFINNAHDDIGYGQVDLLNMWAAKFGDRSDKMIINMGSISTNLRQQPSMQSYVTRKAALEHAVRELQHNPHKCRYVIIRPGYVDTRLVEQMLIKDSHAYFTPEEFAQFVYDHTINISDKIYIRELVVTAKRSD